jgi:isoleucyl-tRNA synthetase
VLVFTSEEIWKHLPKAKGDQPSVHLSEFPDAESLIAKIDPQKKEAWEELAKVRSAVLVKLEEARNAKSIGGSLEAKVSLYSSLPKLQTILKSYAKQLPALFIVSQVQVLDSAPVSSPGGESPDLGIVIVKADGKKCERCWNYSTHVGENSRYPTFCERCSEALAEIEGAPAHAAP